MSATALSTPSRLLAIVVTALALVTSAVVLAPPASAHYDLVSTDPAADSVVDAAPAQITLTFSGDLLSDPGATAVEVVDSTGASLTDGEPAVQGAIVTQALAGESIGAITVRWKVVYDDGHAGSDEFGFTIEGPTPTPTPTPTATSSSEPTTAPTPTETPSPTALPAPPMETNSLTPWLIGGGILLLAAAGAVTYLLVSRARRESALNPADRTGSEPPAGR